MASGKINFESELSKSRMLEIQRKTRLHAKTAQELADDLSLSIQCISPFIRHMREKMELAIEKKVNTVYGNKPKNYYRYVGAITEDEIEEPVIIKVRPVERDDLVTALFGAA